MIKIIGNRGTGKTTKLIEISAEKKIPILCKNSFDKYKIMKKAAIKELEIPTPILFNEKEYNKTQQDVLVDELDFFSSCLFEAYGYKIKGFTLTKNDLGVELYEL